tara:strand:- start:190 stop:795 length:606 start_codon:yes stop_codon:yes gene_type:complete
VEEVVSKKLTIADAVKKHDLQTPRWEEVYAIAEEHFIAANPLRVQLVQKNAEILNRLMWIFPLIFVVLFLCAGLAALLGQKAIGFPLMVGGLVFMGLTILMLVFEKWHHGWEVNESEGPFNYSRMGAAEVTEIPADVIRNYDCIRKELPHTGFLFVAVTFQFADERHGLIDLTKWTCVAEKSNPYESVLIGLWEETTITPA